MSEYGRAWESFRRDREDDRERVRQLMNSKVPSVVHELEGLISKLKEYQIRWEEQDRRLAAVPD